MILYYRVKVLIAKYKLLWLLAYAKRDAHRAIKTIDRKTREAARLTKRKERFQLHFDNVRKKWNMRQAKKLAHPFTPFEVKIGRALGFIEARTITYWTGFGSVYCYMGNCDGCGSPNNHFRIPIYGELAAKEDSPKIYLLTRNVYICPGCQNGQATIGIFKSYDATKEFEQLRKVDK